jgi:asparagine synthase (glutamine-hydrolysing)
MLDKVPGSHTVDKLAMSCLAYTGINATRNTSFSGIKKLLAGETKVYNIANRKFIETKRIFIKPTSDHHFAPIEFKKMAKKTVEMCSIGQRKIGVFLSGGLDSSLIAHELNKLKGPAITFTNKMKPNIVTEEDFNSDANAAEKLAKVEGYQHTVVKVTPDSVVDSWNDSIYYMEQPMYNQSVSMYYHTNKVLHDNGIVVTMAGDMGDEILGGYPKYWKLTQTEYIERMIGKKQIESWDDVLTLWMLRIKRPLAGFMMGGTLSKKDVFEELKKCYPDDLWNPKDPVASYMALDCVTQVPEEFFMRNDKFGMAFGMEGRFPLATKIFMQYCMSIPSFQKIGIEKFQTKLPTKRAYENVLPEIIIKKEKTGWTVPLGYWLTKGRSTRLTDFYNNALKDKGGLGIIKTSAKAGKSLVPSWIVSDWIKKYKMKI